MIVKVRKHLKLSLDDLVSALKKYLAWINRTNCYRVLRKYDLNTLPSPFQDKGKGKFGYYLPGFVHVDLAYLPILPNTHQRQYLLVGIDRITKLVFLMVVKGKSQRYAVSFIKAMTAWLSYRIHRILTDNGREFGRDFSSCCVKLGIKQKRTKVKHPWTNGQAERIIKTIKQETVWKTRYPDHQHLHADLVGWQNDYNLNKQLKSLRFLTPYQKMIEYYQSLDKIKRTKRLKKEPREDQIIVPIYRAT